MSYVLSFLWCMFIKCKIFYKQKEYSTDKEIYKKYTYYFYMLCHKFQRAIYIIQIRIKITMNSVAKGLTMLYPNKMFLCHKQTLERTQNYLKEADYFT